MFFVVILCLFVVILCLWWHLTLVCSGFASLCSNYVCLCGHFILFVVVLHHCHLFEDTSLQSLCASLWLCCISFCCFISLCIFVSWFCYFAFLWVCFAFFMLSLWDILQVRNRVPMTPLIHWPVPSRSNQSNPSTETIATVKTQAKETIHGLVLQVSELP